MSVHSLRSKFCDISYSMNGKALDRVCEQKYLGVTLASNHKWNRHITATVAKANRTLGLVPRNFHMCSKNIKSAAYFGLVRPNLEYATCAWDPYTVENKRKLESVQHKAARFVAGNYIQLEHL